MEHMTGYTITPCGVGSFTSPGVDTRQNGPTAFSVSSERHWQRGVITVKKLPKCRSGARCIATIETRLKPFYNNTLKGLRLDLVRLALQPFSKGFYSPTSTSIFDIIFCWFCLTFGQSSSRLTDGWVASSLLTTGLFALSKLTWTWSVSAEVFGLNNLFVAVLMLLAILFESTIHDTYNMSKVCTLFIVVYCWQMFVGFMCNQKIISVQSSVCMMCLK